MTQDINTLALAKLYESQGYLEDALKIYLFLDENQTSNEVRAGVVRMEKNMGTQVSKSPGEQKISILFEKWLMLMVLKQRLDNFKKIKLRLT